MGFLSNLLGNAGVATVDELSKEFGNLLTANESIEITSQQRLPTGTLRFGSLKFIYASSGKGRAVAEKKVEREINLGKSEERNSNGIRRTIAGE